MIRHFIRIRVPDFFPSWFLDLGVKKPRIPDPDPQHCFLGTQVSVLVGAVQGAIMYPYSWCEKAWGGGGEVGVIFGNIKIWHLMP
jgi:hypothetical protein